MDENIAKSVDKRIITIVATYVNKNFKFPTKEIQEQCWFTVAKQFERYKELDWKNLNTYLDREKYWNDRIFKIEILNRPCCMKCGWG